MSVGQAVTVLSQASRPRWMARRRKGLTATDAVAILGLSPWATPLSVWLDKVAPEWWDGNYSTRRGAALERFLAVEWAAHAGAQVRRPPRLVAHPRYPLLLCSLDFVADTPAGPVAVECKTDSDWRGWDDGAVPDHYACQALVQAAITGLPVVIVADVVGRLEVRRIDRQPEWEAETIPILLDWWQEYVAGGNGPPPLDQYRDYALLNRVWQPDPGTEVEVTPAVMGAVEAYVAMRREAQILDRLQTGLKTQIRAHMQTATSLVDEGGAKLARVDRRGALTVTYKPSTTEETAA